MSSRRPWPRFRRWRVHPIYMEQFRASAEDDSIGVPLAHPPTIAQSGLFPSITMWREVLPLASMLAAFSSAAILAAGEGEAGTRRRRLPTGADLPFVPPEEVYRRPPPDMDAPAGLSIALPSVLNAYHRRRPARPSRTFSDPTLINYRRTDDDDVHWAEVEMRVCYDVALLPDEDQQDEDDDLNACVEQRCQVELRTTSANMSLAAVERLSCLPVGRTICRSCGGQHEGAAPCPEAREDILFPSASGGLDARSIPARRCRPQPGQPASCLSSFEDSAGLRRLTESGCADATASFEGDQVRNCVWEDDERRRRRCWSREPLGLARVLEEERERGAVSLEDVLVAVRQVNANLEKALIQRKEL